MPYLFDMDLLQLLQEAFVSAVVKEETVELSDPEKRDYFFLAFQPMPEKKCLEKEALVNVILAGDKQLTEICNNALKECAIVEVGFRWYGSLEDEAKIIFSGFAIKIIYAEVKTHSQKMIIQTLNQHFAHCGLIKKEHDLSAQFSSVIKVPFQNRFFCLRADTYRISQALLEASESYIAAHILPVLPAYVRSNELAINPVYQDASTTSAILCLDEKKIWALRSDFILALGNKNAYWTSFAETGLGEAISPRLHRFVNWEDRYGHPSLACPHPGYNGSVFYAGLLAQRAYYLEIYISSGRYYRNDLAETDKAILEAYIAYQFRKTYGDQLIVFCDAPSNVDYFECTLFYKNLPLPSYCTRRTYDLKKITEIFEGVQRVAAVVCGSGII